MAAICLDLRSFFQILLGLQRKPRGPLTLLQVLRAGSAKKSIERLRTGSQLSRDDVCLNKDTCSVNGSITKQAHIRAMRNVADSAAPWSSGGFTLVQRLEKAQRNKGHVDLMTDSGGRQVAVKQMPNSWCMTSHERFDRKYARSSEKPWHDLGFLQCLQERNFAYMCDKIGLFRDDKATYVVTSLATEGDLFRWSDREVVGPGKAREALLRPLAYQMFSAVRWLHELGIVHRDLSLENILITRGEDGLQQIKLIDFGMATLERKCRHEVCGKAMYQPPEMHESGEYESTLVDSFALGVVLFAMATKDYPWASTRRDTCHLFGYARQYGWQGYVDVRELAREKDKQVLKQVFSTSFSELLGGLLDFSPKSRFTVAESREGRYGRLRTSIWGSPWISHACAKRDGFAVRCAGA